MAKVEHLEVEGFRFTSKRDSREVASILLFLLPSDLNPTPIAIIRELKIEVEDPKHSIERSLISRALKKAKAMHCREKIMNVSRGKRKFRKRLKALGFKWNGLEFRCS